MLISLIVLHYILKVICDVYFLLVVGLIPVCFILQRLYTCLKPDPVVQREIEEKQALEHRVELVKV